MLKGILTLIYFAMVITGVFLVIRSRKAPESTLAWILAIGALPVFGLLAYILIGYDWRERKLVKQIPEEVFAEKLSPILSRQSDLLDEMLHSENPVRRRTASNIRLLNRVAAAPVTGQNTVTSFFKGIDKFESLIADIEAAKKSIHMEYFIWRSDELGERIRKALEAKAAQGVSVRLLFDGWGSFGRISFSYRKALKAAGIEYAYFLDLSNPVARMKINYRNHRKIAVFDGRIAYTGGMNVGREYIDGGRRFETWRDTHLRIEGPAVSMLQALFLIDWRNSGKELLAHELLFPDFPISKNRGGIPIQIAIGGPDSMWDGIRLHYTELINGAREEILIQTPYFIPGEEVEHAMIGAALRGISVILMTVGKPDKLIPFWAAQTYFAPLLEAGVEIYLYQAGFLHSKVFIQDRKIASVGTCNVDIRSFVLNYEVNAVMYSPEEAALHADQFFEDLAGCSKLTKEQLANKTILARFRNSVARLSSPLI